MKRLFYLFSALVLHSISSSGQDFEFKYHHDGYYKFDDTVKRLANELFTTYKSEFSLTKNDEMVSVSEHEFDSLGTVNNRYQQYYKGYPIEASMVNVISQYGVALYVNGFFLQNFTNKLPATTISEKTALYKALQNLNFQKYRWQDSVQEADVKHYSDVSTGDSLYDSSRTFYPKGELVIAHPARDTAIHDATKYKLCWKFMIEPMKWDTVVVDTNTIDSVPHLASIPMYVQTDPLNVYIDAETGNVFTVDTQGYSSGFWVTCGFHPLYYMGDQNGQMYKKTFGSYFGKDARGFTFYFNSEFGYIFQKQGGINWNKSGSLRGGLTAYWGLQQSWDYFSDVHGYTGGPEWNRKEARVNCNEAPFRKKFSFHHGRYYDSYNLETNGTTTGHETAAELDLTAHEYTHAMIHYGTHLDDFSDAGAILEGFCDYFGTLIAMNKFPSRYAANWSNGFGFNSGYYARNFSNPSADAPIPSSSSYHDSYHSDDIHRNSGVFRKWLALMTNGSSTLGFAPGPRVEKDAFITMQWWVWSNLNFQQFRNQCLEEYEYYHGKCSPAWQSCYKAWAAVGISTVGSLFCRRLTLTGGHVAGLGMSTRLRMIPTNNDDVPVVLNYKWVVPNSWRVSYSQDSSEITIDSTFESFSRMVHCMVIYNDSTTDTFSTYMHVLDQPYAKSTPPVVASQPNDASVELFPNPVTNKLNIVLNDFKSNNVEFILRDLSGRIVFSKTLTAPKNSFLLPKLDSGLYIAETQFGTKSVFSRLVIQ